MNHGEPRNILVRTANWVGDAVMTLPALASIRNGFPQARLAVLAKPWVADLFTSNPLVDRVILYQSPGRHEGVRGKWKLALELRKERFDLAVLFQNAFEAALLSFLARIPRRTGYGTDARSLLLTRAVPVEARVKRGHQVDYYLEMVKALGFPATRHVPTLGVSREHEAEAGKILASHGLAEGNNWVGLGPGATYGPAKQWPPERFADLADRLVTGLGAQILIFGSAGDKPAASRLAESLRVPVTDLTGKTTLGEAIGLIGRCRLFVSNDSGLMHVAAALGIPVVGIFGSTDPKRTGPLGERCRVVRTSLFCSPCLKARCPDKQECLEGISVERVFEEARKLWNPGG